MKIEFYKPKNDILKKYIEGYYFITEREIKSPIKYWTFPNNFCISAVYKGAELVFEKNKIKVFPSHKENIATSLVSRYISPIEILQNTIKDEITIYFKPLGLNHFVNDITFNENITEFFAFADYESSMRAIFKIENRELQIQKLENYWLSKLNVRDLSLIESILSDVESDLKIDDIAKKNNLTRQYISKLFFKNIGKTPTEYRKIHRFRNAIVKKNKTKNLTDLSYENLFYDQSHLIKDFKNFTKLNPTSFFKNVDINKENIWLLF